MAKFSFHGHPDVIESLQDELPTDGTPWGEYLLEAVQLQKRATGPGLSREVRTLERKAEIEAALPDGDYDTVEYILECIQMRKKVEGRELVLAEPDTRSVDEKADGA